MTKIKGYIQLLKQYNEHTNIYAKSAYNKLEFHIQDSINLAGIIQNKAHTVVDFGSGSGLPSLIIAIQNPKNKVIAIESKSRKRNFLEQVKLELDLDNFEVFEGDISNFIRKKNTAAHFCTAKAFAKIPVVQKYFNKLNKTHTPKLLIPISQNQKSTLEEGASKAHFLEKTVKGTAFSYYVA